MICELFDSVQFIDLRTRIQKFVQTGDYFSLKIKKAENY